MLRILLNDGLDKKAISNLELLGWMLILIIMI